MILVFKFNDKPLFMMVSFTIIQMQTKFLQTIKKYFWINIENVNKHTNSEFNSKFAYI